MTLPLLHVISPQGVSDDARFAEQAASLQAACGPELALHLRDPGASGRRLFHLARELTAGSRRHGGWCIVNERLDVALAVGAQAAQLGHRALPLAAARRLVGERLALGASVHSAPEVRAAAAGGANYVVLGTIFPSPSHPDAAPLGLEALAGCADAGIPVVAIGGIDRERGARAIEAGASAVAVLSAVWGAPQPVAAAAGLLDALSAARPAPTPRATGEG